MKVFGLTGGIASGKSEVSRFIHPIPVINADDVSREVVVPGSEGLAAVTEAFGGEILLPDGALNRTALRQVIAGSKEKQQLLNSILHPLIFKRIQEKLAALEGPVAFVDAALMIETGSYKRYDGVLLVTAPMDLRLKRLMARDGMAEQTARNLMAKQWTDEEKRRHASIELVNDGSLEDLRKRTREALEKLGAVAPQ